MGVAGMAAYSSTKWAIRGLTRAAALEFAPYGIRVNSVHPGMVATEMGPDAGIENQRELGAATTPLGRIGEAEDVARLVLFLASDASSYCSGAEYVIDGGQTSGLSATAAMTTDEVAAG
jgi:3alpha(or 20beta)-hydroxysteroid dehydrogenase